MLVPPDYVVPVRNFIFLDVKVPNTAFRPLRGFLADSLLGKVSQNESEIM